MQIKRRESDTNSGIYKITNLVNSKFYIGSSTNISKRYLHHIHCLRANKHCNKHLQNSINKYGINNFVFEVIEECENVLEREQFYIDNYKPQYNICITAGSNKGIKFTKEHKEKIGLSNKGIKRSEELKERWSDIKKNNPNPELYKKIVALSIEVTSKAIIQYNKDMTFVKEWNSISNCARFIKGDPSTITKVCKGKLKSHRNFIFKYKD